MRIEKVTCDGCGCDLTTRTNSEDYRLVLGSESKPGSGDGFYTCMAIYPPINRTHHFCDLGCLDHWRSRERHKATLLAEWHDKWVKEHGEWRNGRLHSYPDPPQETASARNEEAAAAALAKFPMKHATPAA